MASSVWACPVLINSSSVFKVYFDILIKLMDLINVTESLPSLECFWEIQIMLRNSVKFTLMGQETWKSFQVNCEHPYRRWTHVHSGMHQVVLFWFLLASQSLADILEYKKIPTTLLEYSLLKAACTQNTVHDSFKRNAAASWLLFLYSLFLFSHCFLPGFVTDWFGDLVFFWLTSCSLPVGRNIDGGEGWERLNTIKL